MRDRGKRTAGVVATALALTLVAMPAGAQEEAAGTATTTLTGAEIVVSNLLGNSAAARVMDLSSLATTDGTPFAQTSIVPIDIGGETVGESGASSEGDNEATSPGGGFGDLAGLLGVAVQPVATTAEATADSAIATIDAATAQVAALSSVLDLDLVASGIVSEVDGDGSSAVQGLAVTGLDLGLGDLGLGADILGQLGLDQLLALLSQLPLDGLPVGAAGIQDEVLALQASLEGATGSLQTVAADLTAGTAELTTLTGELTDLQDLLADLQSLDLAGLLADTDLLDALNVLGCDVDVLSPTLLEDMIACVQDEIASVTGDLTSALGDTTDAVSTLEGLLATATSLVDDLLAAVGGLDTILDLLPGLLGDAEALTLVGVGAFDVGASAIAADTLDESSATLLCAPVDVTIIGEVLSTPDCSDGLSVVSDLTGTISDAVGEITGLLNTLPLDGLVEVGDLRADLFSDLVESVEEADGVITSTAGITLLDLQVPSVTIDPSAVTDPLADLGVPDVLGSLEMILDDLASALGDLDAVADGLVPDALLTTVTDLVDTVDPTGSLAEAIADLVALIDGLDLGELGTLSEGLSTPALSLVIDPVSQASFTASSLAGPTDPPGAPDDDDPELPTTGGGLALLGILALSGAAGLRRLRR